MFSGKLHNDGMTAIDILYSQENTLFALHAITNYVKAKMTGKPQHVAESTL